MKSIIRFIFDVFLFGFLFISILYYLDAINENLKLNKGVVFFIDVLITGYIFYRYELSFLESGIPKYKNPPEPPTKNWDKYVKSEQEKNLKMINHTIPKIINDIKKRRQKNI